MKADLIKTRELIADPEHWLKGMMRGRRFGTSVHAVAYYQKADCFCLFGAMFQAVGEDSARVAPLRQFVEVTAGLPNGVIHSNDRPETTHADVLAWLDAAIEAAP